MKTTRVEPCPLCDQPPSIRLEREKAVTCVCGSCGLQYLEGSEQNREYFRDYFDRFRSYGSERDILREKQYGIDARWLQGFLPGGSVLDVGCSHGGFLEALSQVGDYDPLHGIDIDESAIRRAQERAAVPRSRFEVAELQHLQTDRRYDAVVFRGSLQYLGTSLAASMSRVVSLLRPGGFLFALALPNAESFLYHVLGERWHLFHPIEHRLIFSRRSIKYLAERYHFDILTVEYPYLDTVYAHPEADYGAVTEMIKQGEARAVPFWGNMLQVACRYSG